MFDLYLNKLSIVSERTLSINMMSLASPTYNNYKKMDRLSNKMKGTHIKNENLINSGSCCSLASFPIEWINKIFRNKLLITNREWFIKIYFPCCRLVYKISI